MDILGVQSRDAQPAYYPVSKYTKAISVEENRDSKSAQAECADISAEARNLDHMDWLTVRKMEDNSLSVQFKYTWQITRVLEKGYLLIDGKKIMLDEQQQKELTAAGQAMERDKRNVANRMIMAQQLATARQQADAWKKSSQEQSRMIKTSVRMMKGEGVSINDEKELAEKCPELYSMAKSVAEFIKMAKRHKDREKTQRIAEENERQRQSENEPKDYSTPSRSSYPDYEVQVSLDVGTAGLQISSISEVTTPPAGSS